MTIKNKTTPIAGIPQGRAEHDRILLAAALEQAEETVAIAGTNGIITYVNPAFERLTGFSKADVIGRRVDWVFKAPFEESAFEDKWEKISQGQRWHGRIKRKKRDGETYEVAASITPIYESGIGVGIVAYVIVERDLTNEVRIEKQMRQSQKMESLGTLAGGIAHDLNNILMPIVLNTELLIEQMEDDSPYLPALEKVLNAAHRGRDLVKQVVTFSRRGGQERLPLALAPLIKEALTLIRASLPADIEVKRDLEPTEKMVAANPSQIHQVLLNLCSNAADAIGNGRGAIEVRLQEVVLDRFEAKPFSLKRGPHLRLSVEDTGSGIAPSLLGRIFEPFFTTKGPGEGTGMGLATVHGIVKQHHGAVDVISRPGQGSTFHLYFPCVATEDPVVGPMDDGVPSGTGTILVVDDDPEISATVCRVLEGLGYEVTSESDPAQALERFKTSADQYDLVLTDQTMRGMKGLALASQIHDIRPNIPIILCTGHIDYVDRGKLEAQGKVHLMMKPVNRGELARSVFRAIYQRDDGQD